MTSPGCVKDVQRLTGKLMALSRFLGASAEKALPFFNLMKKGIAFEWTPACEEAFIHFKKILSEPPMLSKPREGEPLYLYLAVTTQAMAAVLVREEDKTQRPIYFISKGLQGAELKYTKLENLAYALLTSSRRLKQYFQGHVIILRTNQAIRQALQKPNLAGRMMAWAVELSQYDLQYEPRQAIKIQAMVNFLVEVTGEAPDIPNTRWKPHVDGASNQMFGGAGIILENSAGVAYEQSIKFDFSVFNNQAEYEALIGGIILAKEVGASRVEVSSDSQIVTSQINGSESRSLVISDNGAQFTDKNFKEFLSGLGIKQRFSSVEHPQSNGQVEAANKVILKGLKKRLEGKKGSWADELASVLWSYRTSLQSSTGETPFQLTYGVDAVIPVEIGEPSPRLLLGERKRGNRERPS
ncbi:uncharacterized protein [Arachis hypogaea]|uniref:uncharacterized protein n=1 Tax=Arachis hypogaea TaxID=3818 RepID=UPI003B20D2AE